MSRPHEWVRDEGRSRRMREDEAKHPKRRSRPLHVHAFHGSGRYVESTCDVWYVLSASHGLVPADEELDPYDETLNDQSADEKRSWSRRVLASLDEIGFGYRATTFEIHAGNEYRSFGLVDGLEQRGATVVIPAAHLGQGKQLAFYSGRNQSEPELGRPPDTEAPPRATAPGRSYQPLAVHLERLTQAPVVLTFREIERILGRDLPASARKHRAWWSNESGSHIHARGWIDAGWSVESVDFNAGEVGFGRR